MAALMPKSVSNDVAYLSPLGWPGIYSIFFPNWRVIRILPHWREYFLPLSDSKKGN